MLKTLPAPEGQQFGRCWLAFAPDGKRLFSAGGDGAIHCWDLSMEKQIWSATPHDDANEQPLNLDNFHLSADGKRLTTLSLQRNGSWGPGEEIAWDPATGTPLWRSAVPMASQTDAYSPDGLRRTIWTGEVYDVRIGSLRQTLKGAIHDRQSLQWRHRRLHARRGAVCGPTTGKC